MSYNSKYKGSEVDAALDLAKTALQEHQDISGKQDVISDLATIRSGAEKGATAVQPSDLATVATSGSYSDLSNKPTIPTVNNATLTIQKNGTSVGTFTANASSAKTINIETQLAFTNKTASSWVSDSTYSDYPYRCDIACSGVTANDYAEVIFDIAQATSGEYAPLCETNADIVSIWSATNTSITIPTIIITK